MLGAVVVHPPPAGPGADAVLDQLTRLHVAPAAMVDGPAPAAALLSLAELLRGAADDVLVVAAGFVVHDEALADLVADPRRRTAALLARDGGATKDTRVRAGQVVDAGSAVHPVPAGELAFTGALRVARQDAAAAAAAAAEMAQVCERRGWHADPVDLLMVALVRRGVDVGSVTLDPWPWRRGAVGGDPDPLRDRLAGLDAHRVRLARATKAEDGFWATFVVRRVSRRLTPVALRLGVTPNQVTALSFVLGLAAAGCFALGHRWAGVAGVLGAVLLQLSLVVDCVDGDVARYRRAFTPLGAWLDAGTDRVKEFACYAGLAVGAGGSPDTWLLAGTMLTLQTVRHTTDYTFTAVKDQRETTFGQLPLDQVGGVAAGAPSASRAVRASERSNERPAVKWTKRVVHMPIGERWLVISAGAAVGAPRAALVALLGLGLVSLAYTGGGRTLRARAWPRVPSSGREREIVAAQLDPGPLAGALARVRSPRPLSGRFLWVLPPALRLAEYATVLVVARTVSPGATAAAYAVLLAVAYHHYDELYGVLNRLAPVPAPGRLVGLGVEGRVLLVVVLALFGAAVLTGGLWVAAACLGALFLGYGTMRVWREVVVPVAAGPEAVHG